MSRIDITSSGAPLSDGILQTANPLDATLQVVTDNVGTSSTLLLSTAETQVNSTLRIKTDNSEILDIENSSGNRFNINRSVQNINLDFASKPTDLTTQVGAIRTAIDGTNLADVIKFQENGQVTLTERVKIESDSTVTTQTSSVIQATTTNSNLVLAPNGTGAIVASIPDGTATGGNARGSYAIDLQTIRTASNQVAGSTFTFIGGGEQNRASQPYNLVVAGFGNASNTGAYSAVVGGRSNVTNANYCFAGGGLQNQVMSDYSTVSGGQSNTASTNTHATVVGGQSNTASGNLAVAGGWQNTASGSWATAFGRSNTCNAIGATAFGQDNVSEAQFGICLGGSNRASSFSTVVLGYRAQSYLYAQNSLASGYFTGLSDAQQSLLTARRSAALTTGGTTVLSLDGTGATNLIIPSSNNRAWNVQVNWVAVVTAITGTATGISVGDVVTSVDLLGFKKVGGTSSASAHTSAATKLMVTTPAAYAAVAIAYTAGASQEMALTFTGPTFVGGGSVTMQVVARIELAENAW